MELSAVALLVVLVGLMSIGLPITWALGGACISAILLDPNLSLAMITQKIFTGCDNFAMLALPAFFLAGDIMAKVDYLDVWFPLPILWSDGFQVVFPWYLSLLVRFLQLFQALLLRRRQRLAALCILKWLNEITLRIIRPRVKRLVVP